MGNTKNYKVLDIILSNNEYPIYIGQNLLLDNSLLRKQVGSSQVFIVTNTKIAPLYLNNLLEAYKDIDCKYIVIKDGEQYKNQESLFKIFDKLANYKFHRDATIVALGGGVIGDLSAFAASTYLRGVPLIHIPTSLLAKVDSSIGGKTAINHFESKNMIGSFYHPQAIIMDINTLLTLPNREFKAGFAEIIKYAILVGGDFLESTLNFFHHKNLATSTISDFDINSIELLITKCCQIKVNFIKNDELDKNGLRALLNLGHTFAHALETITKYQRFLHGEAVAIGLFLAASLSYDIGILDKQSLKMIESLLINADLPRYIPIDIDLDVLFSLMLNDKKIKHNKISFVLIKSFGECYLETNLTESFVKSFLTNHGNFEAHK
jgi:3-dehydroquinate synthase